MAARNYFTEDWVDMIGLDNLNRELAKIGSKAAESRLTGIVFPESGSKLLLQAFRETSLKDTKVVILGQDPYHDGTFNGLAFGNGLPGGKIPKRISPSLENILKEVTRTEKLIPNPSLYSWAYQGVLLIHTAHTVVEGIPNGHRELWEPFTDLVISALNKKEDLVWLLWGSKAQLYADKINSSHKILKAGHPSPLNSTHPFAGCGCFEDCNNHLKSKNYETIIWS